MEHGARALNDPGAEILSWPAEDQRREDLRARGVPRLLVLEAGTLPPPAEDDLEDWIWLPADERDVFARLRHLAARRRRDGLAVDAIEVSQDGRTWIAGHEIHLPPAEAAILRCLAEAPGRLRTRRELQAAAWGDVAHQRRSLDSRVFVLRRRIAPHGLAIHAVRGRGFVLTTSSRPDAEAIR